MIASATFYLAFTHKIYVARATRCHICLKMTVIGANGSDSREEGSGLACWSPSPTGEPSLTVSMEDYWSLSRLGLPIENY